MSNLYYSFFFFNDTPPTEIYTLSLHDALPIFVVFHERGVDFIVQSDIHGQIAQRAPFIANVEIDRKSTRLNSSHTVNSYAVFCLKKKIRMMSTSFGFALAVT